MAPTTRRTVTKTGTATKIKITREVLITKYMDYVLENEERPKSVYKFAMANAIDESEFYSFFGSFEGLRESIWAQFFSHTTSILEQDENYLAYPNREKMLAFLFTFFEVLSANRSYVLFTLRESDRELKNLKQLRSLRVRVKDFASDIIEQGNEDKIYDFAKNSVSLFSEGAWLQTLFLIKYWLDDNSANFEDTDIAIEKSVRAIFDVFDTSPLESVFDFGKFLFKNRFAKRNF